MVRSVFITGISSGIGRALAEVYLDMGYVVFGLSRTPPYDLLSNDALHFHACDLTDFDAVQEAINDLDIERHGGTFETLFLNAGKFGSPPHSASDTTMTEFINVFALNVMAVKATLDACLALGHRPNQVFVSSSIASQRQRAGMAAYCSSKAALNALIKVYQLENPDLTFYCLGLCNVDTYLSRTILQAGAEFPELFALRKRAENPGYIVSPKQRALDIVKVLTKTTKLGLVPGQFYEIRDVITMLEKNRAKHLLPI